jgi:hypothetical protein
MGVVLNNADAIRASTGATFLWIHHCGKDQARGMRGWSGMRAAIDTEIEVTVDEVTGLRTAEVTKQRDLPGKGERIGFRLEPVHLGFNRWGSPRGSCVVVAADAPAKIARGKRPSEIAGAIVEVLTQHGTGMLKGAMAKHFDGRYTRSAVYRELQKMVSDGRLIEVAGVVAMPGLARRCQQVLTGANELIGIRVAPQVQVPTSAAPFRGAPVGTTRIPPEVAK